MTRDDFQEVLDLGEGVYRVKYHRLNIRSIRNLRSRLLGEVMKTRRELGHLRRKIEEKRGVLKEKEALLNNLSEEKIQKYIELEKQREALVVEKANVFLRDYIGIKNYEVLQKKGFFEFKGQDGKQYRIKRDATLQQASGNYWCSMCVITPKNLPLPDIIASVFTAACKVEDGLRGSQRVGRREVRV